MRSAPTPPSAATPPRCVRRVVHMASSNPSQPLRHARIKQRGHGAPKLANSVFEPRLWIPSCHFFVFAPPALRTPGNFMALGLRL